MRLRLFTLLLVPISALVLLGYVALKDRQADVDVAARASSSAALAVRVADLDKALGAEALASTRYIEYEVSWPELAAGSFVAIDIKIDALQRDLSSLTGGPEIGAALTEIEEMLSFRSGIRARDLTQLEVVDLYSQIRRGLLASLSVEVGAVSGSQAAKSLLVLTSLTEARSEHFNERIAVDIAIESGGWPSGQHSAVIAAMASHDTHLRFANYQGVPQQNDIAISNDLANIRQIVRRTNDPPPISVEVWDQISDDWGSTLEREIDASAALATERLRLAQDSAGYLRNATLILIGTTLLLAFGVAVVVSYRIVKRVQAIAWAAALLATGDTTAGSLASNLVGGNDEITDLAEAFDNMALQISSREDALAIESTVLEAIASGQAIEPTLTKLEWLLGSSPDRRDYRFTSLPPDESAQPINDVTAGYAPLYVVPVGDAAPMREPFSAKARSAMSLAALAQRRAEDIAMLHRRATRDPLTGLLNRRAILEQGAAWIEQAQDSDAPFPALIYADLDGFKKINDTYGHAVGDLVLVESAKRMRNLIAEVGGNVGRIGGDEFVIIASGVADGERLAEISKTVVDQLSEPIDIGAERVKIGVSIGAVLARPDTATADLISDADVALYAAKAGGRGHTVISDPKFREQAKETEILTASVVEALKNEEFIPWFQPVWAQNGTQIAAFEALVRWKSPEGRTLSPGRFLPILEQQNLIGALDALTFKKVCQILAEWMAQGRPLVPMHLNVSPSRIENLNFVADTKAILAETGVPPELIIVEVTESDLMTDISQNGRRLQELRDIGILIAADDFGTGYSSLSYLRDLPVDILKIDRQFIDHIDKSPTNIKIVSAIIGLARSLGLPVVAEGVERDEELSVLNEHGCHYIQGFLLGKPTPRKETESLLARHAGNLSSELWDRLPAVPVDINQRALNKYIVSLRERTAEHGDRPDDV